MLNQDIYNRYFNDLLAGNRLQCHRIVKELLDGGIDVRFLYEALFQKTMYQVGELWENNRITVANEHLATSITESLLNLVHPIIFETDRVGKTAVISCGTNDFHQVGGKMVADVLELHGWDSYFLGANTPYTDMAQYIQENNPDLVGFSLGILQNIDNLKQSLAAVVSDFPNLDLTVGGQAFRWGGVDQIKRYSGTEYVSSLTDLEIMINA